MRFLSPLFRLTLLMIAGAWLAVYVAFIFIDTLQEHAIRRQTEQLIKTDYLVHTGPRIGHCFEPDAGDLWDCIRHKE